MRRNLVHERIPFNPLSFLFFLFSGDREGVFEAATGWMYFFSSAELNQSCLVPPRREQKEVNQEEVCNIARTLLYIWSSEWMSWEVEEMLRKEHILVQLILCVCGWSVLSDPGAQYHMENASKIIPLITCCSIQICVLGGRERKSKEIMPPACVLPSILSFILLLLCSSQDLILFNFDNIHERTEVCLNFCRSPNAWQMTSSSFPSLREYAVAVIKPGVFLTLIRPLQITWKKPQH